MSDIQDRLKFNSGTDKVTKSVADAVSEVLNSGQAPQTRMEKQAALHNYPLQEKPEVAETFVNELKQEVAQLFQQEDSLDEIGPAGAAIAGGIAGGIMGSKKHKVKKKKDKEDVKEEDSLDEIGPAAAAVAGGIAGGIMGSKKHKVKKKKNEDASNNKSDDGEGLDKADPKAAKKKFKDRKDKDIDNDGDVDSSDKFLHKKRKAISKAIDKKEDATQTKYDGRSKSFKETLRRLGYVKKSSLIYDNKRTGK